MFAAILTMSEAIDILGLGAVAVDDLVYVAAYPPANAKVPVLGRDRQCGGLTATALVAVWLSMRGPGGTVQSGPMMLSAGRRLRHALSALAFIQGRNSVRPQSLMSSFM